TAPTRQQTLRAALDWSHALLAGPEAAVFRRLAASTGGWSLDAAEAVCAGTDLPASGVLDLLTLLVDKSLVVAEGQGHQMRYGFLEPVRQYALWRLHASGEAEASRSRHASYYLALAERAEPAVRGPEQVEWLDRLEREHDNL